MAPSGSTRTRMGLVLLCVLVSTAVVTVCGDDARPLTQEELLQEIEAELRNIEETLNELLKFLDDTEFPNTLPPSTTPDRNTPSPTTPDPNTPSPTTPDPNTPDPTTPDSTDPSITTSDSTTLSISTSDSTTLSTTTEPTTLSTTTEPTTLSTTTEPTTLSPAIDTNVRNSVAHMASIIRDSSNPGYQIRSLLSVRSEGQQICVDVDSNDKDDPCRRLKEVMQEIEDITKQIESGEVTQEMLDSLKQQSAELEDVVEVIKKDPSSVTIDKEAAENEVKNLEESVKKAAEKIEIQLNLIITGDDPTMVIVLGVFGGLMVVALFSLGGFVVYKKKNMAKMGGIKLNGESAALEMNSKGQDNRAFQTEFTANPTPDSAYVSRAPAGLNTFQPPPRATAEGPWRSPRPVEKAYSSLRDAQTPQRPSSAYSQQQRPATQPRPSGQTYPEQQRRPAESLYSTPHRSSSQQPRPQSYRSEAPAPLNRVSQPSSSYDPYAMNRNGRGMPRAQPGGGLRRM